MDERNDDGSPKSQPPTLTLRPVEARALIPDAILEKFCKRCQRQLPEIKKVYCSERCKEAVRYYRRSQTAAYKERQKKRRDRFKEKHGKRYIRSLTKRHIKARSADVKRLLDQIKDVPCMDCGGKFPVICMDFDHREPTRKKFEFSKRHALSYRSLVRELAKCDVVCSNCHRIRTERQQRRET